ncbi:hypothetical protein GN156_14830 [bacterium LRH843]|nr:hypothetical protein [bacterium LRH843]
MVRNSVTFLGFDIQTIYFIGLIISVFFLVIYFLFGDLVEALWDVAPGSIFNPIVALSFKAVFSASGYILETVTSLPSISIIIISLVIALVIVSVIHFFILLPLSKAEQSMTFSINDLKGKTGNVIMTIPKDGLGEVLVSQNHSVVGYPAKSAFHELISTNTEVVILKVEESVLIVRPNTLVENRNKEG